MSMHPVLKRQIDRYAKDQAERLEQDPLLEDISKAYYRHDRAQTLYERALDLTSEELLAHNLEMKSKLNSLEDAHAQMEQLLTLFNTTIESASDGILLMDSNGDAVIYNEQTMAYLDTDNETLSCINYPSFLELITEKTVDHREFAKQLNMISINPSLDTRCTLEFKGGKVIDCYSNAYEDSGSQHGMGRIWNFHDITELVQREKDALHQSLHDGLTSLPNRNLFLDRLNHAMLRCQRKQSQVGLMFIDLDGFKYINDTLGHHIGDSLLKSVTERLCEAVRANDTVGRQGGDEFLVLLDEVNDINEACMIAERLLETMRKPFYEDAHDIFVTASIGITMYPGDGEDAEMLIRNADMAMYRAKQQGRDNYQLFMPDMVDESSRQLSLHNKLNYALHEGEFELAYQPIIDLKSQKITSIEALIRWNAGKELGVGPENFIPVAEKCGLIIPITEWVIAEVCQQARFWKEAGLTNCPVSINVSALHFKKGLLFESLQTHISLNNLKPEDIGIEITESALIQDLEKSAATLQRLQDFGVNVAIDDFGTGYSSFTYLKNLPISTIKIDPSFIIDITHSERDLELAKAMISISHTLGMNVIAEGVEEKDVQETLTEIGCDQAQGFLFHYPMSADEIIKKTLT